MQTERNLLLGILALQMDFIAPDALLAAMRTWFVAKTKSLGQILVEQNALSCEQLGKLEALLNSTPTEEEVDPDRTKTIETPPPPRPRYQIRRLHAKGGLGQIFLAEDEELHRDVALKEIQNKHADDRDSRARFLLEAEVTGGLEHPGIVPVYGLGTYADGRPYYAMRFIRGHSLRDAIQQLHNAETSGRDPAAQALALRELLDRFLDVCNAVAYAHSRGVLHRDLKPSNVMLGNFGETLVVDWGLAKLLDVPEPSADVQPGPLRPATASGITPTQLGAISGSPHYMAPEQAQGRSDRVHVCTDIYGLGGILFEILTGQPPHPQGVRGPTAPRARSIRPTVPLALDEIAARALSPEPADRYPTVKALSEQVQRWLAEEPVAAFRALVTEFERRVQAHPNTPEYREHLARNHTNLGLVLDGMGRYSDSESAYRAAITEYDRLVSLSPAEPRYRAELATCRVHLGRTLTMLSRQAEAQEVQQAAVKEYNQLISDNPRDYRTNLASVMITLMPGADQHPEKLEKQPSTIQPDDDVTSCRVLSIPPEIPAHSRGRLTFLRLFARGGAGSIWIARDGDLNRQVAVKVAESAHHNVEGRRRFLREAQIMAQLEHSNIVPIYGLGFRPEDDVPFITMRFVSGETLQEAIAASHGREGGSLPQELRRLLRIYAEACRGIAFAHSRGIVHRDPKPSNILLGGNDEVYVTDWGLAKIIGEEIEGDPIQISEWADLNQTAPGVLMGTPAYMAPEIAGGGAKQSDTRTDVYSLGVTLFHILTGRTPYEGKNLMDLISQVVRGGSPPQAQEVNPAVPAALNAICARAMARKPEDRYATVSQLREDVISWLEGGPVSAPSESTIRRLFRRLRRS